MVMTVDEVASEVVILNRKELESKMFRVYNMLDLLEELIEKGNLSAVDVFGESETSDNKVSSQTGYISKQELYEYFKEFDIDIE